MTYEDEPKLIPPGGKPENCLFDLDRGPTEGLAPTGQGIEISLVFVGAADVESQLGAIFEPVVYALIQDGCRIGVVGAAQR